MKTVIEKPKRHDAQRLKASSTARNTNTITFADLRPEALAYENTQRMVDKALQTGVMAQVQHMAEGRSVADGSLQGAPIQRKIVTVPKGDVTPSAWTYIRSDATQDYYDDGLPEPSITALQPTRDAVAEMDTNDLSELDESDTELDAATKGPHKVYRVNNMRDTLKMVHHVMRPDPDATVGVRIGGNSVFRLSGKGTQYYAQTTSKNALLQTDGSQGTGYMPARTGTDPKPTGPAASYEHVMTELNSYNATDVAHAVYNKFTAEIPYPSTFSVRAQAKLDEMFMLLAIIEPFRADYAWPIFTAAIQAVINGTSLKDAFYKGKGQVEALHAGASSHSRSGVSGQLMEQNLGKGTNDPHPTQSSMSIGAEEWKSGADRTLALFDQASAGTDYSSMLRSKMLEPMGFTIGARAIDSIVASERASPFGSAAVTVRLMHGKTLSGGEKVIYNSTNYTVKNVTATGWVNLV